MLKGTTLMESVTFQRDARLLRESFTRCRRDVACSQDDPYARNLIKRVESGRVQLTEHIVTIAWDAFQRGAPQCDVEAPGHAHVEMVAGWYEAQSRGEPVPMPEIIRRSIDAQLAAVSAETAALAMPCPKTFADMRDAERRAALESCRAAEFIGARMFTQQSEAA
jgi:hypothetical protein